MTIKSIVDPAILEAEADMRKVKLRSIYATDPKVKQAYQKLWYLLLVWKHRVENGTHEADN